MGIVSLGVVVMGVIKASIVGIGILSVGITTMELKVWSPVGPSFEQTITRESSLPKNDICAYQSKAKAEHEAKKLSCISVQKMGGLSMPCAIHAVNE